MAQAVFAALTTFIVTAGKFTIYNLTGFQAFAALSATYAVLGAVSKSLFSASKKMDTQNGINFNVRDPASTRKIIYGKARIGGTIVFFNTSDENQQFLHMVIAVAGHEVESIEEIYFGERKIWSYTDGYFNPDGESGQSDSYNSGGTGKEIALVSPNLGDQTTVDSNIFNSAVGFTDNHILRDTAYVYIRLRNQTNVLTMEKYYPSGVPNISFVVKGAKVYDPRTDTTAYSDNPALILNDYLTNERYGLGEDSSNIDETALIAAANYCDQLIDIDEETPPTQQKRFTCNGVLDTGTMFQSNIEDILSSMMGTLNYSDGKYFINPYKDVTPHPDAITDSMLVSPLNVSTKRSRQSLFNAVKGKFVSEEHNYIVSDYPYQADFTPATQLVLGKTYYITKVGDTNWTDIGASSAAVGVIFTKDSTTATGTGEASEFIANDGELLSLDLNLPMTTNNVMAQRIAKLTMLKSRQQMTISFQLNMSGLKYKVGDNINVVHERFSWTSAVPKRFEITKLTMLPDPDRGLIVEIEAVENDSSAYSWSAGDQTEFVVTDKPDEYTPFTVQHIDQDTIRVYKSNDYHYRWNVARIATFVGLSSDSDDDPFEPYLSHYLVRAGYANPQTEYGEMTEGLVIRGLMPEGQEIETTARAGIQVGVRVDPNETVDELGVKVPLAHQPPPGTGDHTLESLNYFYTVMVQAVNNRGVKSRQAFLQVKEAGTMPDFEMPLTNYVIGTFANPTSEQINALAQEADIAIQTGTELTYVQVDSNGDPIASTEFEWQADEFTAFNTVQANELVPSNKVDYISYGTFDSGTGTTIINSTGTWSITGGKLVGDDITLTDIAYQEASTSVGDYTCTFDIDSISGVYNSPNAGLIVAAYDAKTQQIITSDNYATTGTHSFTYDADGRSLIVFLGDGLGAFDVTVDNLKVEANALVSKTEYHLKLPKDVTADVTFTHSEFDQVGISDTGVTETYTGFSGTNLTDDLGRKYVVVSLSRSVDNPGFSQHYVTVEAEWQETGVGGTVNKHASITVELTASVLS